MHWLFEYMIFYLIVMNLLSAFITIYDKLAAICDKRRISERFLMNLSVFGGSVFMYLTMLLIRHKTKHQKFMIGIPVIIICQAVVIGMLCYMV